MALDTVRWRDVAANYPDATRADLEGYVAMLKECVAVVQKGIAEGKTVEQLKSAKVLAKWDKLSWAFISTDKFVEQLYTGLTGAPKKP